MLTFATEKMMAVFASLILWWVVLLHLSVLVDEPQPFLCRCHWIRLLLFCLALVIADPPVDILAYCLPHLFFLFLCPSWVLLNEQVYLAFDHFSCCVCFIPLLCCWSFLPPALPDHLSYLFHVHSLLLSLFFLSPTGRMSRWFLPTGRIRDWNAFYPGGAEHSPLLCMMPSCRLTRGCWRCTCHSLRWLFRILIGAHLATQGAVCRFLSPNLACPSSYFWAASSWAFSKYFNRDLATFSGFLCTLCLSLLFRCFIFLRTRTWCLHTQPSSCHHPIL